ncbi:MAG: signal peptidase II [Puniceicoccales bacterium]|jgi:signal peptidase II|nr:signal peptidase II [Puniceicoccales bacterium]
MNSRAIKYLYLLITSVVALSDQLTKTAMRMLADSNGIRINSVLSLSYGENTGAAWSMFRGHVVLLSAIGILAMIALFLFRKYFESSVQKIFAAVVAGGILGNTIDRIWRGYVIDFINVDLKIYRWPTFNVADAAICIGVIILLFTFQKKAQKAY